MNNEEYKSNMVFGKETLMKLYRGYKRLSLTIGILAALPVYRGCDDNPEDSPFDYGFVTSAVFVVNPVINEGSTTNIQPGSMRDNVYIKAGSLPSASSRAAAYLTFSYGT